MPVVPAFSSAHAAAFAEALRIVESAAALVREHDAKPRTIRHKGRIDLVTQADGAVEAFLKKELAGLMPGATFMAEESAESLVPTDCCWMIDPISGTTNFAHGLPLVGISVALWLHGRLEFGVVNAPLLHECYVAARGDGAYHNGVRLQVSRTDTMENALVATGVPYSIAEDLDIVSRRLHAVLPRYQSVRCMGCASLQLAWVARGRLDVYYERNLKPWDMAAGILLVQEAGGNVTHLDGAALNISCGEILASNGILHEKTRALL